jgi:hypothetical protein
MAAVQRIQRRAINLLPTSKVTAQGIPAVKNINLNAPAQGGAHDDHHGVSSVRHDFNIPSWASKIDTTAGVLHMSSRVNGEHSFQVIIQLLHADYLYYRQPANYQLLQPDLSSNEPSPVQHAHSTLAHQMVSMYHAHLLQQK